MDKILICCALWSISHAAYISRMAPISRFRGPSAFRPGVVLQRPIFPPRLFPAASNRTPMIVYRNVPHRYAVKPMMSPVTARNVFGIPWKTTAHIPVSVTPDYDFARAASAQPVIHTDGAIHTIPAPNLSLSEKPIVVADVSTSENKESEAFSDQVKPTYEVTEKNTETHSYNVQAKIETPTGFYKPNSGVSYDIKTVQNDATQFNPEYSMIQVQQQVPSIVPQQFSVQKYNGLPSHQELIHSGAEGIVIPPSALLQSDPLFLQKLQTELLQRYPAVEFIPYDPNLTPHIRTQHHSAQESQQIPFYFNSEMTKQEPMTFVPSDFNRNKVQRQTAESSVQSLAPQSFKASNVTESQVVVTTTYTPNNTMTSEVVNDTQVSTTIPEKNLDNVSENNTTNPIYYTQTAESNIVVNSIYTAINDMDDSLSKQTVNNVGNTNMSKIETITTVATTTSQEKDTKHYLDSKDKPENNEILKEYQNYGSPFEKPAESVNIAYALLRGTENVPKDVQNTTKTADKVDPIIKDDKQVNRERSLLKKVPTRFSVTEKRSVDDNPQQVIKAVIPPKSKLIYDDKTGEPILRVYASYVDNPARKEAITQKLTNMRLSRETPLKKQENYDHFDAATVNGLASDVNQYGLKIKPRNDASSQIILEEYN